MEEKLKALNEGHWSDFAFVQQPVCPHCGDGFDIKENEAWHLYDDQNTHEVECPHCGNGFRVNSHATWSFSTDEQED